MAKIVKLQGVIPGLTSTDRTSTREQHWPRVAHGFIAQRGTRALHLARILLIERRAARALESRARRSIAGASKLPTRTSPKHRSIEALPPELVVSVKFLSMNHKEDESHCPRRVLLPMSTGITLLPHQSAQITARSQLGTFCPDRLLIKNGSHWNIDDGIEPGDCSEAAFSPIGTGHRSGTAFSPVEWCPLPAREVACGDKIVLGVTYIGPNECGEPFEAALFGWDGSPPTVSADHHEDGDRISERTKSPRVSVNEAVKLPLILAASAMFADRLTITDAPSWIVNDVRVRGESIFVQSGDVPGEMFSADDTSSVALGPLTAKDIVEVVATYIGDAPSACLVVALSGTAKPPRKPPARALFLPMLTGVNILPTTSAQITGRPQERLIPQGFAFLPERVVLTDEGSWAINDIKVGVLSQFAQSGDVPGAAFSSRSVGCHVRFNPVRPRQDFVIVTTYVGAREVGAPFVCGVQGRLVPLPK